ncbi:MAG: anthranilate/aminodeoxychorismate synthase component II [Alphaproteobacteria bacterium]|nr:anthranilate/aminodeoxychorismate synthase component II [Alphaproteobacteria bacterium]
MILIIDNYDSFVYNLARYVAKLGRECVVNRNDAITVDEVKKLKPEAIILSPGPCAPDKAGICVELIKAVGANIPVLGVCLGHQAIGEAYGGKTVRAGKPVHGKSSMIHHDGTGLFEGVDNPFEAGRYHSLIVDLEGCNDLVVTARSDTDEIMAMKHKTHPVYGVQFHPESVLTDAGLGIMANFLNLTKI